MKYRFSLVYELDTTLAIAVGTYLDVEHILFLHRKYCHAYRVLEVGDRWMRVLQAWSLWGIRFGQTYLCEYIPPATFRNSEVRPSPIWLPSIHHLVRSTTVLEYRTNPRTGKVVSRFDVELEMPFWLFPFRRILRRAIERLKIEKDQEDMEMIARRAKLFGRSNNSAFFPSHQFLYWKDDYCRHFGRDSAELGEETFLVRPGIGELPRPSIGNTLCMNED